MKSGGEQEFSSDKLSSACYLVFHWRWVYHQNIFNCSPSTGERLASAAASLGLGRTGGGVREGEVEGGGWRVDSIRGVQTTFYTMSLSSHQLRWIVQLETRTAERQNLTPSEIYLFTRFRRRKVTSQTKITEQ